MKRMYFVGAVFLLQVLGTSRVSQGLIGSFLQVRSGRTAYLCGLSR